MKYNPKYALYRIDTNLGLAESNIDSIIKKYNISFELNYNPDINCDLYITEGIIDKALSVIKTIGSAVLKAITYLWKKLTEFVKTIYNKIKKFFTGENELKETNHPEQSVSIIKLESADMLDIKFNNKKSLTEAIMKSIEEISNKISQLSKEQISYIEEYNRRAIISSQHQNTSQNQQPQNPTQTTPTQEAKILYGKTANTTRDVLAGKVDLNSKMSLPGRDIVDSNDISNISNFDKEKTNAVLEAQNIVKAYNDFIDDFIQSSREKGKYHLSNAVDNLIDQSILDLSNTVNPITNQNYTENEIREFIKNSFFDTNMDPDHIRKIMKLRINYNKKMVTLLSKMVETNYKILSLSKQQSDNLSSGIKNNDSKSMYVLSEQLKKNIDKFIKSPGFMDLRELGAGVIFFMPDKDPVIDSVKKDPIPLLQISFKYDCVIFTHGSDSLVSANPEKYRSDLVTFFRSAIKLSKDFIAKQNELDATHNLTREEWDKRRIAIIEKNKADMAELQSKYLVGSEVKQGWMCMPVKIGSHPETTDVNDAVRMAIQDGYKKIFVLVCNPGDHTLDPDIVKTKGVIIHVSHSCATLGVNSEELAYRMMGNTDSEENANKSMEKYMDKYKTVVELSKKSDIFKKKLDEIYKKVDLANANLIKNQKNLGISADPKELKKYANSVIEMDKNFQQKVDDLINSYKDSIEIKTESIEYIPEAGGPGPGGMVGTADLAFVTQYGPDSKFSNVDDRVEGYALHNDIITDNIITVDKDGKVKKESYDFLNNRKIRMFQYKGNNISEAIELIIESIGDTADRAFIYEELTGRELLSDDQILCDEEFEEIDPNIIGGETTSTIQTMVEQVREMTDNPMIDIPVMNVKDISEANELLEDYGNEVQVFESVKGYYVKNLKNGKRTACYKKIKNIPVKVVR